MPLRAAPLRIHPALDTADLVPTFLPVQVEQDFLQRQIRQIVQSLARLTGSTAHSPDLPLDALDRGYDDLFGMPRALLDRIDEASLAMTLGTPEKLAAYAWILDRQAEIRDQRGEHAEAAHLRARAQRIATPG